MARSAAAAHLRLVPPPAAPAAAAAGEPLAGEVQLFPEAYEFTIAGGDRALLPAVRRWLLVLGLTFVLLFLVSAPLWWSAAADLRAAVDRALAPAPAAPAAAETRPDTASDAPAASEPADATTASTAGTTK